MVVSVLSLPLCGHAFHCCVLNIRQLEFHRITILTRFVLLCCVFETGPFVVVCGGLVFLFFVAPSFAVFRGASAFNQDVSKWNTGAVTTMEESKCTCILSSLSLSVATAPSVVWCGVEYIYTTTRGSSGHKSHTYCFFFCVV